MNYDVISSKTIFSFLRDLPTFPSLWPWFQSAALPALGNSPKFLKISHSFFCNMIGPRPRCIFPANWSGVWLSRCTPNTDRSLAQNTSDRAPKCEAEMNFFIHIGTNLILALSLELGPRKTKRNLRFFSKFNHNTVRLFQARFRRVLVLVCCLLGGAWWFFKAWRKRPEKS